MDIYHAHVQYCEKFQESKKTLQRAPKMSYERIYGSDLVTNTETEGHRKFADVIVTDDIKNTYKFEQG